MNGGWVWGGGLGSSLFKGSGTGVIEPMLMTAYGTVAYVL